MYQTILFIMSRIITFNINNIFNEMVFKALKQFVSPYRRERSEKYLFIEDAKRCICAEVIIRFYLIMNFGMHNSEIEIEYNDFGKPYIRGEKQSFNISHSNDWVVCGWSNTEIGVDIEKIRKIDINIAKTLFCESEYEYISKGKQYEQYKRLIQIWTLKESYMKYVGKGFSIPLNSFCINKHIDRFEIATNDVKEKLFLKQIEFSDGYYLAECSSNDSCIILQEIALEEIMKVFC